MKMLLGLRGLSYMDRLGLYTLKCRRLREDIVEVCEIMGGIDKVKSHSLLPRVVSLKLVGID